MRPAHRIPLLLIACLLGAFAAHAAYYWPFLSDDALISFRYSRRFIEGDGLTWTDGERVEGYTNFLWVLLVAPGCKLAGDCIPAARFLAFAGAAAAVVLVGWSPRIQRFSVERWLTGGTLLVASAPLAVWSIGGLEHGIMAGTLMAAFVLVERVTRGKAGYRELLGTGLPLGALALLRADGFVLIFGLLAGSALVPRLSLPSIVRTLVIASVPLGALMGQLVFRRFYYGEWQPNTAVAKVAFNLDRLKLGFQHLTDGYAALGVAFLVAAWATWRAFERKNARATLPGWTLIGVWSLYLLVVGGDIFPGWRQLVFVVVALAAIVAVGLEGSTARLARTLPYVAVAGALHLGVQLQNSENRRAKAEVWEWDGLSIGHLLKTAFGAKQPLLAVDAAGALPYWSELPSLDMLGLNDRFIAHNPPPSFGHGPIGHELGHGGYVLRRAPDVIAFNNAAGSREPLFLSGRQMLAEPQFHERYQWIRVQGSIGNRAFGEFWLRREGGKLGVVRSNERVEVPGYFFSGQASDAVARLDGQHRLVTHVTDEQPGVLPPLELPAGRYRLELDAGAALVVGLRCGAVSAERRAANAPLGIDLARATGVSVALAPTTDRTVSLVTATWVKTTEPVSHRCTSGRGRLRVDANEVGTRQAENTFWAHPRHVLFGSEGIVVHLPAPAEARALELSVDNNDTYEVEVFSGGESVFRKRVAPRQNGGGLAVHRLDLPRRLTLDRVVLTAQGGDRAYGLGHLSLLP